MKIISKLEQFHIEEPTAIAIGKFDGVHIGHRELIAHINKAKAYGYKSVVFTFTPSPAVYFGFGDQMKLTTDQEKRVILEKLGVDYLLEYPLNEESAGITPEDYIRKLLCEQLNAKLIVAGPDLSFGKMGKGNFELLNQYAEELGYQTVCIDKIGIEGEEISSSMIRRLVENGEMEKAAVCLGEPYQMIGEVKHGAQLGRTIGLPTLNLIPEEDKLLPPFGVYYSKVKVDDQEYFGMTNLGRKPTVNDGLGITSETFLYNFTGDLYGRKITVSYCKFRRPEMKFENIESLKAHIEEDVKIGQEYFGL